MYAFVLRALPVQIELQGEAGSRASVAKLLVRMVLTCRSHPPRRVRWLYNLTRLTMLT